MAKRAMPTRKANAKPKPTMGITAEDHRKMAAQHSAKARLHSAQADLADAKNPPKGKKNLPGFY